MVKVISHYTACISDYIGDSVSINVIDVPTFSDKYFVFNKTNHEIVMLATSTILSVKVTPVYLDDTKEPVKG